MGILFMMVIASMLPYADIGRNVHQENKPHFINLKTIINHPNRINLPSPHPQWRLFSLFLIHIFATGSAVRVDLFYWDWLYSKILKSLTPAPKASLINLGYRLLMSNMLKLKRKRPITTSQNHSDDQNTQL